MLTDVTRKFGNELASELFISLAVIIVCLTVVSAVAFDLGARSSEAALDACLTTSTDALRAVRSADALFHEMHVPVASPLYSTETP